MISLEKNYFKNQKPQIPIGPKISLKMYEKCMKYVNKMKKKGQKGLTDTRRQKP